MAFHDLFMERKGKEGNVSLLLLSVVGFPGEKVKRERERESRLKSREEENRRAQHLNPKFLSEEHK